MKNASDLKEQIIVAVIGLINDSGGDVNYITTRRIAEKANVGIGLVNYHFQTKENLIKICVQRIIHEMLSNVKPSTNEALTTKDKLIQMGKMICDFYIMNPAVSRISILADLQAAAQSGNINSQHKGAINAIFADSDVNGKDKAIIPFMFTSVIQFALLRKEAMAALGYDFDSKNDRDAFVEYLAGKLYHENNQ